MSFLVTKLQINVLLAQKVISASVVEHNQQANVQPNTTVARDHNSKFHHWMIMLWEVLYHQADARLAFIVLKEQLPLYPVQLVNITQAFKRIAVSHVLKEGSVMKKDLVIQLLELKHANQAIIVS